MRRIQEHVAANLDGDLRVAKLAARLHMSGSCFARWFRARMGISPHAYVLEVRLMRARRLLRETDRPLIDVALTVGFSSQACMNVAFMRREGITPGRIRALASRKAKDAGRSTSQVSRHHASTGGPA
jgi:AraC family transcriptional regulator